MDEERFTKLVRAVRFCSTCRVGILTIFTEEKQDDGAWKVIKIQRNCGHVFDGDPS